MSDYDLQLKLAAKGLAERDNHPMPESATTAAAFYEVMAAAALDAIDLPALLDRATRAERELEIMKEALTRADAEAKYARHQPTTEGEVFEESSIASILREASTSRGPGGTHISCPSSLPRDSEHPDAVEEQRRSSLAPPAINGEGQTKPPPQPRQPRHRTRRRSRKTVANYFQSFSWRKLLPPRSPLRNAGT